MDDDDDNVVQLPQAGGSTPRRRMGRPSSYTPEAGKAICDRIAAGATLAEVCALYDAPDQTTVSRWKRQYEDFRLMYAQAQEIRTDAQLEEILAIGRAVLEGRVDPHAGRVAIDGIKWTMGKMNAKRYGDRSELHVTGDVRHTVEAKAMAPSWLEQAVGPVIELTADPAPEGSPTH